MSDQVGLDKEKLVEWLRNYPKELKGFNPTGLKDLIEMGRFDLQSPVEPVSKSVKKRVKAQTEGTQGKETV